MLTNRGAAEGGAVGGKMPGRASGESVVLLDYWDPAIRHELFLEEGRVVQSRAVTRDDGPMPGVCGFGRWAVGGLAWWARKRVFVAAFARGERLHVRVGQHEFRWPSPDLRYRHRRWPLVREVVVKEGATTLLSLRYWFTTLDSWPTDGDLFAYIAACTESEADVRRVVDMWNAAERGEDLVACALAREKQGGPR